MTYALNRSDGNMMAKTINHANRSSSSIHGKTGFAHSSSLTGNLVRQDLRRWLSPPDPSTNHNVACSAHHEGTATWFFQGNIFKEWKSSGSLLWVHGKRMPLYPFPPST